MIQLASLLVDATRAAEERNQAKIARTFVRAATNSDDVVYRTIWPSADVVEHLNSIETLYEPTPGHPLDSVLALCDGLSVIEVFAPGEEEHDSLL
jgi:hypothetical protein